MHKGDIAERVKRVFEKAASNDEQNGPKTALSSSKPVQSDVVDALFIFNSNGIDKNYLYLTGLPGGVFENCGVVVENGGKLLLISTALEEELSLGAAAYDELIVYRDEEERDRTLKRLLSSYRRVGVAFDRIPHSFFCRLREFAEKTQYVDASRAFRLARMVKSADEIERIGHACGIADRVAGLIPSMLKEGMMESDLGAEIDYRIKKEGGRGPSFDTIVAFGENTSKPHYGGGSVRLRPGDHILVDFGAEYEGYHSDITRIFFTGTPEEELASLYGTVREAKELGVSLIKDGVDAQSVEERVKERIESHDRYRGRFIHSLGHSLGLDVHDDSYPFKSYGGKFCENMVLTVEPGVYLPGLHGVRLEDDVVVTKEGCKPLTSPVKEPEYYEI